MGRGVSSGGHSSGGGHSHSSGSRGSSHSHSSGRSSYSSTSSRRSYSSTCSGRIYNSSSGKGRRGGHSVERHGGVYVLYPSSLFISIAVFLYVILLCIYFTRNTSDIAPSTIPRERVTTANAYINDCVVDEIGWIDNEVGLAKKLKHFYEKTGCQPYIILKAYDPSMDTVEKREKWSKSYYDSNFPENQNVVLYVYFCDAADEGYGNDTLFVGTESSVVMDSEAQEIFWNYLDYDWNTWDVNDNDGMFADVFNKTADRIMKVTTTTKDIVKYIIILFIVTVVFMGIITLVVKKYKRKREEAAETERILNTPISKLGADDDSLCDKYT